ncbi:MAG TPA: hypothetical protein VJ572_06785 [Azonexus sp.]|nr:hypothetical protein [Azonexus sp.]
MSLVNPLDPSLPVWTGSDGKPLSCTEKIKVLNENLLELRELALATLEDGLLIGCTNHQLRAAMHEIIDALHTDFQEK